MQRFLRIGIFNLGLLVLLLGLVWLAEHPLTLPTAIPPTPSPSPAYFEPTAPAPAAPEEIRIIAGSVVGLDGQPVSGARVSTSDEATATDADGRFQLSTGRGLQWVTVEHPGFLSRTRAASPDAPVLVRLTPDDGETISIHFVGDTMFGRRFYDPNEDGDTSDGLLRIGSGASEHLALLSDVQPLLENADLTVANLESSLLDEPYIDPTQPRPDRFHPTKEYIFATHTSAAVGLWQAGVDVIDIANNHLYDALDTGVVDTLRGLEQAGFRPGAGYFGAGLSEEQAWRPAVFVLRGQSVAFLGCTSITYPFIDGVPDKSAISYFASDAEGKGGAARCEEDVIRAQVAEAAAKYDVVVFMVHGGSEYERAPTDFVVRMTNAAREAGATLIVNHQPHVVGGFDWDGSSLVAWTLGNFAFDQTLWATLESYLLAVHLRRGEVVQAYVEPLMIEGYVPKGITGALAEFVARGAAGREMGPFVVENGAMEIDVGGAATRYSVQTPVDGGAGAGTVFRLDEGWQLSDFSGAGSIRWGRDLLWAGSFEDQDVDAQHQEGALWDWTGSNKSIGAEYAYEGEAGARLQRGARDRDDVVLTTLYRIPVQPGAELSVVGMARVSEGANLNLQLSWYPDTRGSSAAQTVEPIAVQPASGDAWKPFRFDAIVPPNTVAVGLFLRLKPPVAGLATADLDNVRIIEWASPGSSPSSLYDHFRVIGTGEATFSKRLLPGAELGNIPYQWSPIE